MKPAYLLYLEKELEETMTMYLAECLQVGEPIILDHYFEPSPEVKRSKEPVVVITQSSLAKELAEIGQLHEGIKEMKKAGVIVLPDEAFLSVLVKPKKINITIKNQWVSEQLQQSINFIRDISQARHAIFFIAAS